jgi:hypothetical protein
VYYDLGRVDDSIRLFGAAEESAEENDYRIDKTDQMEIDRCLQSMRKEVPAERIEKFWALGRELPFDHTISLAESKNGKEI